MKTLPDTIFSLDTLPQKGGDMKIDKLGRDARTGQQRYLIDFPYRRPDGKASHLKRIATGSGDLAVKIAEIKAQTVGSLTSKTFAECSEHYEKHVGYGSKEDVFKKNLQSLGKHKVDRRFSQVFYDHILRVSIGRKPNTVNNYRISVRSVINFAFKSGFINEQPVRSFGIEKMEERDRIWTDDERLRIYNTMQAVESHLYWSVRVAEKNPIRGVSDLWNLNTDQLILFGEMAPCIRFFPRKTGKKKDVPTYLIELDQDVIEHLNWQKGIIPDCPYLFPRMWYSECDKRWKWKKMGSPKRHWNYLMNGSPTTDFKGAQVRDFHFHDLRHVATTYMLEKRDANGQRIYDEDDMEDLGLFYSKRACEIYRNRKAERVAQRVRRSTFVAPSAEGTVKNA